MEVSDPELMTRLAGGDDLALNELMDRWSGRVAAFLLKMTGQRDAAQDLAQETFVRLFQSRDRYQATRAFSTYLFSIASNLARNHARWKSRHPTVSMDASINNGLSMFPDLADPAYTPKEAAESAEKFRAVHEAFLSLPRDLLEAMSLFVYEGMSYSEIAEICQCSPKAVEMRIYRARGILKERLEEFLL